MTTLHDRLSRLADEAPVALPEPGLWQRGRRYRRRRRAGTLAIVGAAVLALGVLAGTTWQRSSVDGPQPANSAPALPDRIWSPSPWLEGTDDAGELGQLAAIIDAERGSWIGKSPGLVGVSATTGEYRFLDLPDAAL
ncbi:MAG: hypothetical protein JWO76_3252, partial [Nocardioides sp.]|nr:hypothetical protein [Nocardioides sp.]